MRHVLWLAFERLPHPDAVCYPAGEDDLRLVRELLSRPSAERRWIAAQLRRFEAEQSRRPILQRAAVSCRSANGLYRLVSWRLAKWLSRVLIADDAVVDRTQRRIELWLNHARDFHVVSTPGISPPQNLRTSAQPTRVG